MPALARAGGVRLSQQLRLAGRCRDLIFEQVNAYDLTSAQMASFPSDRDEGFNH